MIKNRIPTYTVYGLYVFIYVQFTFLGVQDEIPDKLFGELIFCNTTSYIRNSALLELSNEFYQTT